MSGGYSLDFPLFSDKVAGVWEINAGWWDDKIGRGNDFQNYLIEPQTERLLALKPGEKVLDIACGSGRFARRMADLGAKVTAIDNSNNFICLARRYDNERATKIDYRLMDASDVNALLTLGDKSFEAAVCTMALMDMACITPLISSLPHLLKPGGRLVFSILHPVFNSGSADLFVESVQPYGKKNIQTGLKITEYSRPFVFRGEGIRGQPVLQYYFHRPIGLLFDLFFQYGFILDGIEESTFPDDLEIDKEEPSFYNARILPPVLVVRMRWQN